MGLYDKLKETATEGAIFGAAPIVTNGLGFVLTLVYTNYFQQSEYGYLVLLLAAETFAAQLLQFGMGTAFFRSYFDDDKKERRGLITNTTLWFIVTVALTFLVVALPLAPWFAELIKVPETEYVVLMILLIVFDTINSIPFLLFKASRRSRLYVGVQWASGIVQFLVILVLVVFVGLGVEGALVGMVFGSMLQMTIYFWLLRRDIRFEFSFEELKPLLWLGVPMLFNALATRSLIVSDRFFINHYLDAAEVALYGLGNSLCAALPLLVANPFNLIWPSMRYQVKSDEDAGEYYSLILTYITYLCLFFGLGVAVLAPDVLRIAFPPEYAETARVVPLFVLYYTLVATAKGINVGLMVEKKVYWNPIIVVVTAVVNLALNFLLIPPYGMMGAGLATVLSYAFLNWFRWYMSTKFYPVHYEWGRIALLCAVATGMYFGISSIPISNPVVSFLLRGVLAASFPFVLLGFGFYQPRERARLRAIFDARRHALAGRFGRLRRKAENPPPTTQEQVEQNRE